ncbi:hypothetical protein, partial [Pseudomonas asplenii]|uniref:hypothetical protein n=1 Tax=Pseudomonas asplenii TaxID=53407 RepID=UPI0012F7A221
MTIKIKHLYFITMFLAPISFPTAAAEHSESDIPEKTEQVMPSCELQEYKIKEETLIGSPKIKISDNRSIKVKGTEYAEYFSTDDLYKIDDNGSQYYFRITEKNTTDSSIYLNNVAWQESNYPITSGRHNIYKVNTTQVKTGKTLTMLGDSITWWSYGRYFRCMLSQSVKGVTFTGPHTDTFGFGHAGEGGNTTDEMLSRLDKIEPSDYYFVLAGT